MLPAAVGVKQSSTSREEQRAFEAAAKLVGDPEHGEPPDASDQNTVASQSAEKASIIETPTLPRSSLPRSSQLRGSH